MPRHKIRVPVGIALMAIGLGGRADAASDSAAVNQGFLDGFKSSCNQDTKTAGAGRVTDDKIAAYCDGSATQMLARMNDDEMADLMKGEMSAELQQKVNDVVAQCQGTLK